MKKNKKVRDFSKYPRFVPYPAELLERINNGEPAFEDAVLIAVFFQLYLYKHFADYRKFLLDCLRSMGPKLENYYNKDLPPFIDELVDEINRNHLTKGGQV